MKALVCELCGGNDFAKENDFFVCQNCGTKYSTEDAKKIMVEVDNSKKLSNLYERARKSIEVGDLAHAAEYYKEILDENPGDWEAYFYSYLGEFTSYKNSEAPGVAAKLGNTIPTSYDMALENCQISEAEERFKLITAKTIARIKQIASGGAALIGQYEGGSWLTAGGRVNGDLYNRMRPLVQNTIINCVMACEPLDKKLVEISKNGKGISEDVIKECLLTIRHARYDIANMTFSPTAGVHEKLLNDEAIHEYALKIKELDSSFVEEVVTTNRPMKTAKQQKRMGKIFLFMGCVTIIIGLILWFCNSVMLSVVCTGYGFLFGFFGVVFLAIANSTAKKERRQEEQNSSHNDS